MLGKHFQRKFALSPSPSHPLFETVTLINEFQRFVKMSSEKISNYSSKEPGFELQCLFKINYYIKSSLIWILIVLGKKERSCKWVQENPISKSSCTTKMNQNRKKHRNTYSAKMM